jgi:hypothetical protein
LFCERDAESFDAGEILALKLPPSLISTPSFKIISSHAINSKCSLFEIVTLQLPPALIVFPV